jgi:hypothetical protein
MYLRSHRQEQVYQDKYRNMPYEIFVIPGIAMLILGFIRGIRSYKMQTEQPDGLGDKNGSQVKF